MVSKKILTTPGGLKYIKVGDGYEVIERFVYKSKRYNRTITIEPGFYSDGATGAKDINSTAWFVHDHICRYAVWDDGTKIDNWTASTVLGDILWNEGHRARSVYWWFATYFLGGGAARKNGMRRVIHG